MSTNAMLRAAVLSSAALCLSLAAISVASGQDVGGAGIFRAKNPETKKSATKPAATTGTKPATRPGGRPVRSNVSERVEELLDTGNGARDARTR